MSPEFAEWARLSLMILALSFPGIWSKQLACLPRTSKEGSRFSKGFSRGNREILKREDALRERICKLCTGRSEVNRNRSRVSEGFFRGPTKEPVTSHEANIVIRLILLGQPDRRRAGL
jgi:hypothetical protein